MRSTHVMLLKRAWELQPGAIMRGMAQLHAAQPQSLLRLLDLAQSFNALEEASVSSARLCLVCSSLASASHDACHVIL